MKTTAHLGTVFVAVAGLPALFGCGSDSDAPASEPPCEAVQCTEECRDVVAVQLRESTACALAGSGAVKCWGGNAEGQLGQGDDVDRGSDPAQMGAALRPVELGCRPAERIWGLGAKNCTLLDDATLKCWGSNVNGLLGVEDTEDRGDDPREMGDRLPVVKLGSGRVPESVTSSCAVLDDASLKCWHGYPSEAGKTPGAMGDALPAVDLGDGHTAKAVSGTGTVCVLLDGGAVKCWGSNYFGQLGLGDTTTREREPWLLPVVDLGTGRTAIALDVGAAHACVILDDGAVKCWGNNTNGQLGIGTVEPHGDQPGELGDALPAVDLGTGRTALQVAAGEAFTCALLDDHSVKCWGFNGHGELGQGDTRFRGDEPKEMGDALRAVDLGTGRNAVSIAAGLTSACALLDDATVKCWGRNEAGNLGYGDTEDRGDEPGEMGDALPPVDLAF